jgi:hypothetical protein
LHFFTRESLTKRIVARRMEYGDADPSVRIDVRVKDLRAELHLGRVERVVLGKAQLRNEHPVLQ